VLLPNPKVVATVDAVIPATFSGILFNFINTIVGGYDLSKIGKSQCIYLSVGRSVGRSVVISQ